MNGISMITALAAAEISGAGSFFGSCRIAACNLSLFVQNTDRSEVLTQLRKILGEEAGPEAFDRIIKLLEKGDFSGQENDIDQDKNYLENLILSLLENLDIAIKQMIKITSDEQIYENEDGSEREIFLDVLTDLLKTGMISQFEYETVLNAPVESSMPWILSSLKDEAQELLFLLVIGRQGEIWEKAEEMREKELDLFECRLAV